MSVVSLLKQRDVALPLIAELFVLIFMPFVLGSQLVFNIMVFIALAQTINLLFGFAGYMPFGQQAFFGLGAVTMGIFGVQLGIPPLAGIFIGALAAVGLALLISPTLKLKGIYFGIVNFGLAGIIGTLIYELPSWVIPPSGGGPIQLIIPGFNQTLAYIVMLLVTLFSTGTIYWLKDSRVGRALTAIKNDEDAAKMLGVNATLYKIGAFALSSFLAGLTGALYGWYGGIVDVSSVFRVTFALIPITFAVVGGLGTALGPVVASIVLYSVSFQLQISNPYIAPMVYGALLVIVVVSMPNGVWSILAKYIKGRKMWL